MLVEDVLLGVVRVPKGAPRPLLVRKGREKSFAEEMAGEGRIGDSGSYGRIVGFRMGESLSEL